MIQVTTLRGIDNGRSPLGTICVFAVERSAPDVEIRWFLHFGAVMQVRPMCDWSTERSEIEYLPESPGTYRLVVEWRHGAEIGRVSVPFTVGSQAFAARPTRVSRGRWGKFWVPNEYEAKGVAKYEPGLFQRLPSLVGQGAVVYDIGANLGLFAVPFSRLAGRNGAVICFEPNPICVHFLNVNLEANRCAEACGDVRIVPVALTDGTPEVRFTLNFGNSLLGLTHISSFFHQKAGQEIAVTGAALDELTGTFELPPPTLIKMDIEGAEGPAIHGMSRVLAAHRPVLLLEIHGEHAARTVAEVLDPLGYGYEEAESGRRFGGSDALARDLAQGPVVRQVICAV